MGWLTLLNPMNWIKVLGLLKSLGDMISKAVVAIQDWLKRKSIAKKNAEVEKAANTLEGANGIDEKATAACELEKLANPDSDCK